MFVCFKWLKNFKVANFHKSLGCFNFVLLLFLILPVFVGILYVNGTLDFEVAHEYYLTIEGIRKTSTSFSDVTIVVINITDINDHMPEFGQDLYIANISEDAAIGEIVLTVRHNHNQGGQHSVGCKPHLTMLHRIVYLSCFSIWIFEGSSGRPPAIKSYNYSYFIACSVVCIIFAQNDRNLHY